MEHKTKVINSQKEFTVEVLTSLAQGVSYITSFNAKTGKQIHKRPVDLSIDQCFSVSPKGKIIKTKEAKNASFNIFYFTTIFRTRI